MDPHLDATAQADLVRAGEVSSRELVEASIERIEALNGDLNAVIHPLFEQALETEPADGPFQRRAVRRQGPGLPFRGRPLPRGHDLPARHRLGRA